MAEGDARGAADHLRDVHWSFPVQERFIRRYYVRRPRVRPVRLAATAGRIFNLQRFSLHDGPGIRTTVFLKGCPARCLWCHNPESQSFEPEVITVETRCASCGTCETVCPRRAPARLGSVHRLRRVRRGLPDRGPPAGRPRDAVDEVMDEVLRDRLFFQESGGGVTFSGGEPLAQLPFLRALLEAPGPTASTPRSTPAASPPGTPSWGSSLSSTSSSST